MACAHLYRSSRPDCLQLLLRREPQPSHPVASQVNAKTERARRKHRGPAQSGKKHEYIHDPTQAIAPEPRISARELGVTNARRNAVRRIDMMN
jgi:hypothetical protein